MTVTISSYHNGLGDSLQFSTIPEILVNEGYEVHLYTGPEVMPFRNHGIKQLIYDMNPFITGESSAGSWDYGDIPSRPYSNRTGNFIQNWEEILGLKPQNTLPKIYYQPNKLFPPIKGLVELSGISLKYNHEYVLAKVRDIIGSDKSGWYQIKSENQSNGIDIPEIPAIFAIDLPHICDMINSCKSLITLNSGIHSLAAAISRHNEFSHTCILPEKDYGWIMDSKKFVYPKIEYVSA